MANTKMGTVYLTGNDFDLWKETAPFELLALDKREHDDLLSSWMTKLVRAWLHPAIGRYFKVRIATKKPAVGCFLTMHISETNLHNSWNVASSPRRPSCASPLSLLWDSPPYFRCAQYSSSTPCINSLYVLVSSQRSPSSSLSVWVLSQQPEESRSSQRQQRMYSLL